MEVKVLENILKANDQIALQNAALFTQRGVFVVDLMSSPGAGKTSLIERTVERLKSSLKIGVIEGDIASKIDSERIQRQQIPVVQINTGGACHLDANMIKSALDHLELESLNLLMVENVGNLVCPAEFKLGEQMKVMISSVPEGDDKPLKYPLMFRSVKALVLNKIDLIKETDFDLSRFKERVLKLNPAMEIFEVSCKSGVGIDKWASWLASQVR